MFPHKSIIIWQQYSYILFGLLDEDRTQLINTTILLAKIHIFKRQSRSNLNLRCLKSRLKIQFLLENIIATIKSKGGWTRHEMGNNNKYACHVVFLVVFGCQPIFVCEMWKWSYWLYLYFSCFCFIFVWDGNVISYMLFLCPCFCL